MRPIGTLTFVGFVVVVVAASASAVGQEHQTAMVEGTTGATLEIVPRSLDLGVLSNPEVPFVLYLSDAEPGATREGVADSAAVPIVQTMFARVGAHAVASDASARVIALSSPSLDLLNALETPMLVQLRVDVPGVFPETDPARLEPNPYFEQGSVDDNLAEISRYVTSISIVGSREIEGLPITVLDSRRETRPPMDFSGGPGPVSFDLFGVPFRRDYSILVPPGFLITGDTIEIRLHPVALMVRIEALAASVLEGSSSPIVFEDEPPLCELAPPRSLVPELEARDPLCRAGRARNSGSPPACSCFRDDALRNQRCGYSFPDLHVTLKLTAPVLPGERVDATWTIQPFAASGDYRLVPEILVDGKWVPIEGKGKLVGKWLEGKEEKAKASFTMPSRPTILRTRLLHLPEGAKGPVESQFDALIAMRRPPQQN